MADNRFFHIHGPFSLNHIAKITNAEIIKNQATNIDLDAPIINGISSIEFAQEGQIAVLNTAKYQHFLKDLKASACIVDRKHECSQHNHLNYLVCDDPRYASAILTSIFYSEKKSNNEKKLIHSSAKIGKNCVIGHNVVIEENVEIGDNCNIDHNSVIKYGVKIGNNVTIGSNVTIAFAVIEDNVTILTGAKIGSEGFGFSSYKGMHQKIFHTGRVLIKSKAEIGANVTIARGSNAMDTIIGENVMIDSLVQIAHNVEIGKGSIIVAQVGIAGSTKLGNYCVLGGQVGLAGHLKIGDFVQIAAQAGVMKDIDNNQKMGGSPAVSIFEWHKQNVALNNLIKKPKP